MQMSEAMLRLCSTTCRASRLVLASSARAAASA